MVLPFVGLELVAVAAAFVCYGRHAADFEHIDVENGELRLQRVDGARRVERGWPAVWARVEVVQETGILGHPRVFVGVRDERLEVGRLLVDDRRLELAKELRQALRGAVA
jgi:uncharacterized membrane protein